MLPTIHNQYKKIAERLAYFNKLYSKEKSEPEDTEEN